MRELTVSVDRFPIAGKFTIARGSRTEAVVVTATITEDGATGHGECVPYPRYGETVEGVAAAIEAVRPRIEEGLTREALQDLMPAGAARNAVDCALWDLDAKRSGIRAHLTAGLNRWPPVTTAYTISLGSPDEMAEAAAKAASRPILKVKFGAPDGDMERIRAVRRSAPQATLIADANEGWTEENLERHLAVCADEGYALVEQPLPAKADGFLGRIPHPIPILADESVHDRASLDRLVGLYEVVNIKLDKTGGLTEALALADAAEAKGFSLMIGCMVGTSLAMAPALVLAPHARFVDLDGPLLLARDREPGLRYEGSIVYPPEPALWG
jgi:L-alanine-DL-glutamate epimerase-like enolase superfamily enzyme